MDEFAVTGYQLLVYVHLLLFVFWLGADAGVFMLGQEFQRQQKYDLTVRLVQLQMLVNLDMVPRSAWALMVPVSVSLSAAGQWWAAPDWLVWSSWAVGAVWLWLLWDAHLHEQTPRAVRNRKIEFWLKIGLTAFYLWLAVASLVTGKPIAPTWLALKALMFGLIFAAAIVIDVAFKPLGPQLMALIQQGSSDATEIPLRRTMHRTRIWVWVVYLLLIATSFLGNAKPLP
jgi:hypothetical protein